MNNNINQLSGMTKEQVLAGIGSGEIHPNSRIVAQHSLDPRTIFPYLKHKHSFMVGCLAKISPEIWVQIWPTDPYPQDE